MNSEWKPIEGETPIDPSGLKDKTIKTRRELNAAEAESTHKKGTSLICARNDGYHAPPTVRDRERTGDNQ